MELPHTPAFEPYQRVDHIDVDGRVVPGFYDESGAFHYGLVTYDHLDRRVILLCYFDREGRQIFIDDEECVGPYHAGLRMKSNLLWFVGLSALAQIALMLMLHCWPHEPALELELSERVCGFTIVLPMDSRAPLSMFHGDHHTSANDMAQCVEHPDVRDAMTESLRACASDPFLTVQWSFDQTGQVTRVSVDERVVLSHCVLVRLSSRRFDVPAQCSSARLTRTFTLSE